MLFLAIKMSIVSSQSAEIFRVMPLIRLALWLFYLTLTLPLIWLAFHQEQIISGWSTIGGVGLGAIALFAALCEQVHLNEQGIAVVYPRWVPSWFRDRWSLSWEEITDLRVRSTGQGGLVYYLVTANQRAYLLPMRVTGFAAMTRQIQAKTGLDLSMAKPLAQVWMYGLLLAVSLLLGLFDAWAIAAPSLT